MRRTTVSCDGPHCRSASISLDRFRDSGWTVDTSDRDLCPRCASGKCNGEIGPTDGQWSCTCALPLDHTGRCKCHHDLEGESQASGVIDGTTR